VAFVFLLFVNLFDALLIDSSLDSFRRGAQRDFIAETAAKAVSYSIVLRRA
jgi:hypothetical protein